MYKLTSDASYGNDTVLTNSGKTVIGGALSASHTYDVRITVADKFNTATVTASLRTKNVIWSVLPKGLGFAIGKWPSSRTGISLGSMRRRRGQSPHRRCGWINFKISRRQKNEQSNCT